jgi:hypothetical protein
MSGQIRSSPEPSLIHRLSAEELETFVLVFGFKAVAEGLTVIARDSSGRLLGARFSDATFPRPKLQYN